MTPHGNTRSHCLQCMRASCMSSRAEYQLYGDYAHVNLFCFILNNFLSSFRPPKWCLSVKVFILKFCTHFMFMPHVLQSPPISSLVI
jgi:hypothetical protein